MGEHSIQWYVQGIRLLEAPRLMEGSNEPMGSFTIPWDELTPSTLLSHLHEQYTWVPASEHEAKKRL